jgi:transcriptional regulator with XRE-family HTH domain
MQMKNSIYTKEYQAFLKRLNQARIDSGMTQFEVAKKLKQPQSYISKCESGERRVDIIELTRFAQIYAKPINYFVE